MTRFEWPMITEVQPKSTLATLPFAGRRVDRSTVEIGSGCYVCAYDDTTEIFGLFWFPSDSIASWYFGSADIPFEPRRRDFPPPPVEVMGFTDLTYRGMSEFEQSRGRSVIVTGSIRLDGTRFESTRAGNLIREHHFPKMGRKPKLAAELLGTSFFKFGDAFET
jgi:hypothetical protein